MSTHTTTGLPVTNAAGGDGCTTEIVDRTANLAVATVGAPERVLDVGCAEPVASCDRWLSGTRQTKLLAGIGRPAPTK